MADRPLHILIVGIVWPPETFITRLINGLLERGLTITVATRTRPPDQWLQQPGFHWLFTPYWGDGWGQRLFYTAILLARTLLSSPGNVRRLTMKPFLFNWYHLLPFAGGRWDVIYFPWNSAAIFYLPLFDLGCPVVISCRGSQINVAPHDPQRADFVAGLRVTLARATAVHCVSEDIKMKARRYGLDAPKAVVIRPAVDPDFFRPPRQARRPTPPLRLVTTGSLVWVKGYEYTLLALKRLVDEQMPVCLDIIGDGPERQRVLYTIEDLGLQEVVQLYGRLTPEQVRDKLQQAHVFLLSSLSEGISNAVLEAMACGLPVVTTECGGMREAVTDGVEGFVVPICTPSAIAGVVSRLWQQPELRTQMGRAGRRRVEHDFNLSHQADQFQKLLLDTIAIG